MHISLQPFTLSAGANLNDPTGTSSSHYQIWEENVIKGAIHENKCSKWKHIFDPLHKHGQSFKKQVGRITEYFCAKNLTLGFVQVSEIFLDRGSC